MAKARILAAVAAVVLIGCASTRSYYRYMATNPASTQQDFINARYQCLQETQTPASSAYANRYGAAARSVVQPTCSAWNACLAAKGFYRSDTSDPNQLTVPGAFAVPESLVVRCTN